MKVSDDFEHNLSFLGGSQFGPIVTGKIFMFVSGSVGKTARCFAQGCIALLVPNLT